MRTLFITLCTLAVLLAFASPAHAGRAAELTGTWAVDFEASVDFPGINRREIYSPEQIAKAKATIENVRIIVDMEKKTMTLQRQGEPPRKGTIAGVKEKNGIITLLLGEGGQEEQDVSFLPDGRISVGPPANVVLRKVSTATR